MKNQMFIRKFSILFIVFFTLIFIGCSDEDDDKCTPTTWYADADNDGLGNPNVSKIECEKPDGYVKNDDDDNDTITPINTKYLVSASVDGEGYYTTTDNIKNGSISIIGNGYEGWANQGASVDGNFYLFGDGTLEKYKLTNDGMEYQTAISTEALVPGSFYRYLQNTGNGELFLSNFPNDDGKSPYAIINLDSFTVADHGFLSFPEVDGRVAIWTQPLVTGNEIYFGTMYGNPDWSNLASNLITVKFDYPSLTNPVVLESDASAGTTGGYRTSAAFLTENNDIYQHNINSVHWTGDANLATTPTVFTRIRNGDYDDSYVFDISAEYSEPISIWNAWYAGNDIIYANIVKENNVSEWGDLKKNIGKLVEINLSSKTVTELNIPSAPYANIFKAECIENGKFYIPVSLNGGDANIYEITIGGGANGIHKGAILDGSNVYINGLYRNF